ncbi:hypothetical protein V6N13_113422 [Hibiscus sabdariffa]|uniref:Phytocyanin domain-containing protein n=1 Tax=Hibiscus sabdariffa TaxID=183260 RepID=A0ABR2CUL6_9ROSI
MDESERLRTPDISFHVPTIKTILVTASSLPLPPSQRFSAINPVTPSIPQLISLFSNSRFSSASPESMAAFLSTRLPSFLALFLLLLSFTEAKEILVGGKTHAWKIPSSQSDSLNRWAEKARFRLGDSLVWKYDGGKDSVLQVTREAYVSCNTSNPLAEFKDGDTKVKLLKSGPYFFISGANGHCEQGQKVIVVVLSQKHRNVGISPAPSPAEFFEGPAVAPTSGGAVLEVGLLVTLLGVLVLGLF